jgi:hypothetical protein
LKGFLGLVGVRKWEPQVLLFRGYTSIREYVEFMEDSDLAINFNP